MLTDCDDKQIRPPTTSLFGIDSTINSAQTTALVCSDDATIDDLLCTNIVDFFRSGHLRKNHIPRLIEQGRREAALGTARHINERAGG